ncbi:MAG: helix-turn-helix domain-containing protein [Actinobacteria bacterium]|nr:helix-turn-helix domain-containing protein [Actinomycetota bacterium]
MPEEVSRTHRVLAAASRQSLLATLRATDRSLSVPEAARAVGLHRNTVRFHLDLLVSVGLAERVIEQRSTPGRPKVLYRARPEPAARPVGAPTDEGYRALAQLLAEHLSATPDAALAAQSAGRNWTTAQGDGLPHAATAEEAVSAVTALMARLGFDPAPDTTPDRIVLRRCPFADLAREHRAVVCGVHLGMIEGTLQQIKAPVAVSEFEPFTNDDPLSCVVRLAVPGPAEPDKYHDPDEQPHRERP